MKLFYLHGFASSPASSKAQFFSEKFRAAGFDVSIPALDGGDFRNLTITSQLDILEREAKYSSDVVIMGSSLGGYLAAVYAARHPEQVKHAIMMAPAFCFASRWSNEAPLLEEWKRAGVMEMFHYGQRRPREISYNLIADGLEYEGYPEITQPALILHGALDPVVPVAFSREFARLHPENTQLRIYPKSGHELTDVLNEMWIDVSSFLKLE